MQFVNIFVHFHAVFNCIYFGSGVYFIGILIVHPHFPKNLFYIWYKDPL